MNKVRLDRIGKEKAESERLFYSQRKETGIAIQARRMAGYMLGNQYMAVRKGQLSTRGIEVHPSHKCFSVL